jgi:hypothetical protein
MTDALAPSPDDGSYKALKFLTKSLASLVPGFGGTLGELFDLLVADPAMKRRDGFMLDLARRLDELAEANRFDVTRIIGDPGLSALLLHAAQIAARSEGKEKLAALREAAVRGSAAPDEESRSPAYVVMGIIDRLTDYHIILLRWESTPRRSYAYGQVNNGAFDGLHYGQPTVGDPSLLKSPHRVFNFEGVSRYVETQSHQNFKLARLDLIALGLLEPVLAREQVSDGRRVTTKVTPQVAGHRISELGKFVLAYVSSA